jgi:tripartite-type tricarboxylate transporter receptor subunit TctC
MRKVEIGFFGLFLAFFLLGPAGAAETYPAKPISFIVPLEAGADADVLARPFVQKVSDILAKPVIVVNKPGAGSSLGYRQVREAKPDGYTIGSAYTSLVANKLQGLTNFDHRDLTVMGTFYSWGPIIVASTKTQHPYKSLEEVLAYAKSHPEGVSIATGGVGQVWWIATMAFQTATGLKFNILPQPGSAGYSIIQVAGGHADLGVVALASAKPQLEAGNIRLVAVYGSRRLAEPYHNVPCLKELGYDVNIETTSIVIGPPKLPENVVDLLTKTFKAAVDDPEYQKFVMARAARPVFLPPDKAIAYYDEQRTIYRAIMEKAGILKEK